MSRKSATAAWSGLEPQFDDIYFEAAMFDGRIISRIFAKRECGSTEPYLHVAQ